MDNADNPTRKSPVRPFFAPRAPTKTTPASSATAGRAAPRPFAGRLSPSSVQLHALAAARADFDVAPAKEDAPAPTASESTTHEERSDSRFHGDVLVSEVADVITIKPKLEPSEPDATETEPFPWMTSEGPSSVSRGQEEFQSEPTSLTTETEPIPGTETGDWSPTGFPETEFAPEPAVANHPLPVDSEMKYGESDSSEEPSGLAASNRSVPSLATPAFGALTLAGEEQGALPAFHERTVLESSEAAGTDAGDVWKWGDPVSPGGAAEETLIASGLNKNSVADVTDADASSGAQLSEVAPAAEQKMPKGAAMSLEELKEVEPWPMSPAEPRTYRGHAIGEALERVAKRIRDGEIVLPADTSASNDEAALALALAALLRTRPE